MLLYADHIVLQVADLQAAQQPLLVAIRLFSHLNVWQNSRLHVTHAGTHLCSEPLHNTAGAVASGMDIDVPTVLQRISIFGLASARFCMILLARIESRLTRMYTCTICGKPMRHCQYP